MLQQKFQSVQLVDGLFDFSGGLNHGINPLLLPKNQLARATNATLRGGFVSHRPAFRKMELGFPPNTTIRTPVLKGLFQGACYYRPDNGAQSMRAAIAGRLFEFTPVGNNIISVVERSTALTQQSATRRQHWLFQAEKWTVWNDGLNLPVFTDATTSSRSGGTGTAGYVGATTADFTLLFYPGNTTVFLSAPLPGGVIVGTVISIGGVGVAVTDITNPSQPKVTPTQLLFGGFTVTAGASVVWTGPTAPTAGKKLPAGRMGAYVMGRIWLCLVDGKQFVASDLVGGSSGTAADNYRDAILNISENNYLAGGGYFTVPGSVGAITAMRSQDTLDASLGQGPLQVFTRDSVFSVNSPVDRLTWQDLTNPILTQSLIGFGALGQNSTINNNSDIIFRALDGIRSLILARREFDTWGNTPISFEVRQPLAQDSSDLLAFSSAVVFQNRLLMTSGSAFNDHGTYFTRLIPLNLDPISSLRGKAPSIYDSLYWTGLNVFQLIRGEFNNVERCFAFSLNTVTDELEIYELLPEHELDSDPVYDNDIRPITWSFDSPMIDFGQKDPRRRELLRLIDGEVYVEDLIGTVNFEVFYKPDQWPCWVPWFAWEECAGDDSDDSKPGFRPRMGLGMPSPEFCDEANNRPLREGYLYQVRFVITGHCRFIGAKFKAITVPQSEFASPSCCSNLELITGNGHRPLIQECCKEPTVVVTPPPVVVVEASKFGCIWLKAVGTNEYHRVCVVENADYPGVFTLQIDQTPSNPP